MKLDAVRQLRVNAPDSCVSGKEFILTAFFIKQLSSCTSPSEVKFLPLSESLDNEGNEIGIEGSIKIIEDNYTNDHKKHLSDITKKVIGISESKKLSDDLTLISIG